MQATKEMALDVFPDMGLKDIAACRTDRIGRLFYDQMTYLLVRLLYK